MSHAKAEGYSRGVLRLPRPGSCFLLRRRSRQTQSATQALQTNLQTQSVRISNHLPYSSVLRWGLTCYKADEFHMFWRGKHSGPVVLASGGRGPYFCC